MDFSQLRWGPLNGRSQGLNVLWAHLRWQRQHLLHFKWPPMYSHTDKHWVCYFRLVSSFASSCDSSKEMWHCALFLICKFNSWILKWVYLSHCAYSWLSEWFDSLESQSPSMEILSLKCKPTLPSSNANNEKVCYCLWSNVSRAQDLQGGS